MHNLYIFDIDGTLTPSRQKMTPEFSKFFDTWADKNNYYLVTGSDLEKVEEQIPISYIDKAQGLFTCCGNQFYMNKLWKSGDKQEMHRYIKYNNKFNVPDGLEEFLMHKVKDSMCPIRVGNHIENRDSMLNFSVVGRDCNQEQREEYFEWDKKNKERKYIVNQLKSKFQTLEASIGGQISIDIYEPGMDKSQIFSHIQKNYQGLVDKTIFIGDRTTENGNDYPLAKLMNNTPACEVYQTDGPENTIQILKELND
tara:strand:+ start:769 stop:1530 length:762 start_codon:yes stop_codon:yes gene_type:complete